MKIVLMDVMKKRAYLSIFALAIGAFGFWSASTDNAETKLADNEYKVITVQGQIVFEKTGKDMHRGDLYVEGTPLDFKTNESRASIYNSNQGRYVLSGTSRGKMKILPSVNNISTRSGAILNLVDLKNHFDGRYLVIKRMEVQISHEAFPMNENTFFYLRYDHNEESIAKRLKFEGDRLILDAEDIFKIDGKAIPVEEKEMTLYYRDIDKTLKINKFTPVFPDPEELKAEVGVLLTEMKKKEYDDKIEEVTSFLNEFYGRPYKPNLMNWLSAEFGLKE